MVAEIEQSCEDLMLKDLTKTVAKAEHCVAPLNRNIQIQINSNKLWDYILKKWGSLN